MEKHTQFAIRSLININVTTTQSVKPLLCAIPPAPLLPCPAVDPCAARAAPDEAAPALAILSAGGPGLLGSRGRVTLYSIVEGPAVGAAGGAAAAAAPVAAAIAAASGEADQW